MTNLVITLTSALTFTVLSLAPTPLCAQGASSGQQTQAQQTQARGYWTDPSTSLMWSAKDNGQDVSWNNALKFCSKLSLGGFGDWRMPNMDELQAIYDKDVESAGLMGAKYYHNVLPSTWHVKGSIFLTGDQWSTLRGMNDRGKPSGYAYYYDFNEGKSNDQPVGWPYPYVGMRVLCVRGPQNFPPEWVLRRKK